MDSMERKLIAQEVRGSLIVLEGVVGLSALSAGIGLATGVIGAPVDWLDNTPFTSYSVPGLLLAIVGVGTCLAALAESLSTRGDGAALISVLCALVLGGWMATEAEILGPATWLETLYGCPVALVAALAFVHLYMDENDGSMRTRHGDEQLRRGLC
jgi:hypothetical protein